MGWLGHNHMHVEGRTILLTGGSDGTGLSAARTFSSEGANVIIVSRNPKKLKDAIKTIRAAAKLPQKQRFHIIVADVSTHNYAESVVAEATAWNDGHPPEIVWCLAGLSTPLLWTDDGAIEAARYNMDVNYFGSAEMSRAFMRAWLLPRQEKRTASIGESRPASKHIIFTGSILSTFSMAGHGTYAPSKFALRALADALAMEVRLYPDVPIQVHLCMPNSITTAGYEAENRTKPRITLELEGPDKPQHPDAVARLCIAGIRKGHYFITTSFLGELMRWGAMSNSPRNNWLVDTFMGWLLPFILAFMMWDMNAKVYSWGMKENKKLS